MKTTPWILALALAPLAGCATRDVLIASEPQGSFIQVDGNNLGKAPRRFVFDFSEKPTYEVIASAPGYFRASMTVTRKTLTANQLELVLMEDPSWRVTTTTDATNAWFRLQVSRDLTAELAWQKLVDALTDRYACMEQLDPSSGYARSAPIVRRFRGPDGEFRIRTRVLSAIAARQPLVYKVKIQCDRQDRDGDWQSWNRPFKEDGSLLEELQSRLGFAGPASGRPAVVADEPLSEFPSSASGGDVTPAAAHASHAFCGACGARLEPGAHFCSACGKAQ